MLSFIIDKIVVYKDNIDITLNMDIEKYLQIVGVQNYSGCPPAELLPRSQCIIYYTHVHMKSQHVK
jgi:hypothetical protein